MKKGKWTEEKLIQAIKSNSSVGFYYNPLAYRNDNLHKAAKKAKKDGKIKIIRYKSDQYRLTLKEK